MPFLKTDKVDRSKCRHLSGEFQSNGYAKCDIGACGIGSACSGYPNLELMKCCDNHEQSDAGMSVDIETLRNFLTEYAEDQNLMADDFDVHEIIWCLTQKLNNKPMEKKRSEHPKSMTLEQVKDKIDKWFDEHTEEEVLETLKKYKALPNIDYESLYEKLYKIECWCQQTRKKLVEMSNTRQDLNTITNYLKTKCNNSHNTED